SRSWAAERAAVVLTRPRALPARPRHSTSGTLRWVGRRPSIPFIDCCCAWNGGTECPELYLRLAPCSPAGDRVSQRGTGEGQGSPSVTRVSRGGWSKQDAVPRRAQSRRRLSLARRARGPPLAS